jgi:UDP-N-acetylmuramate dehydrogenase
MAAMERAENLERSLREAGFRGRLLPEEPLAPYTTWQIGGPAELMAVPADREDLISALAWTARTGVRWRVLGNGSNLLVKDEGVRGLVLRLRKALDEMEAEGNRLLAGAGASFPALANLAAARGLSGLEFAAGIPGTVGGAIVMNAGWHDFETGNMVDSVDFAEADGTVRTHLRADCAFGYRTSVFRHWHGIVLSARFKLAPGDPAKIQSEMDGYAASRQKAQPTDLPSCGSVYLKPEGDFAGRLIDEAGLKGERVGGIEVSGKHANFFVNRGQGTCADALELMARVDKAVEERFGVRLVREVEIWD